MAQHFTHLHIHTDYSLLDGAIPLDRLIQFAKDNGMKAMARNVKKLVLNPFWVLKPI
jgi:DNA polymerase III alpha subunit